MSGADATALLALDWGSSGLRCFRMAADGTVLAQRREPWGILSLPPGGFPAAFDAITRGWRAPGLPAIASGMVGSRNGWVEAPYAGLPFDLVRFPAALTRVELDGDEALHILPGLADPAGPDVIRGEETEAAGAFALLGRPAGPLSVVLPGTHSKWLRIEDGVVRRFATALTGELYGLLMTHSILARPVGDVSGRDGREAVFAAAVRRGAREGAVTTLFSARAGALLGTLAPAHVPDHVSGLLIGEEIARMRAAGDAPPAALVGDAAVTGRYAAALAALGEPAPRQMASAAAAGLHSAAVGCGLIGAA